MPRGIKYHLCDLDRSGQTGLTIMLFSYAVLYSHLYFYYPPVLGMGHKADGAIDVKMTSSDLFANLEMVAKSGPTFQQQTAFQWSVAKLSDVGHKGQPDLFKFEPVRVKWSPLEQQKMRF